MYFYELDHLLDVSQADLDFLTTLSMQYQEKRDTVNPFNKSEKTTLQNKIFEPYKNFFLRESTKDYSDYPLFARIANMCRHMKKHNKVDYVYHRAHFGYVEGPLEYHADFRYSVMTIPLNQIETPLRWIDKEQNVIAEYEYTYGKPVLINTKVKHGSLDNINMRRLFQVGFNERFEEVQELLI